jgi:hypothetical protein
MPVRLGPGACPTCCRTVNSLQTLHCLPSLLDRDVVVIISVCPKSDGDNVAPLCSIPQIPENIFAVFDTQPSTHTTQYLSISPPLYICPLMLPAITKFLIHSFLRSQFDISSDDLDKATSNPSLPVRAGRVRWAVRHLDRPSLCHVTTYM